MKLQKNWKRQVKVRKIQKMLRREFYHQSLDALLFVLCKRVWIKVEDNDHASNMICELSLVNSTKMYRSLF